MKLLDKLLGQTSISCYVLAKETIQIDLLPGKQKLNVENAIEIQYKWLDNQYHTFIVSKDSIIGTKNGIPVYSHNVGEVFGNNTNGHIGSEYLNTIIESQIGTQMIKGLIEIQDDEKFRFPLKETIIVVGILIGILILWKSGILDRLIFSLPIFGG